MSALTNAISLLHKQAVENFMADLVPMIEQCQFSGPASSTIPAVDHCLKTDDLIELINNMPPRPEIIRSPYSVDADGNPAAFEFQSGTIVMHPDLESYRYTHDRRF